VYRRFVLAAVEDPVPALTTARAPRAATVPRAAWSTAAVVVPAAVFGVLVEPSPFGGMLLANGLALLVRMAQGLGDCRPVTTPRRWRAAH
jgi:hypothetical protein